MQALEELETIVGTRINPDRGLYCYTSLQFVCSLDVFPQQVPQPYEQGGDSIINVINFEDFSLDRVCGVAPRPKGSLLPASQACSWPMHALGFSAHCQ